MPEVVALTLNDVFSLTEGESPLLPLTAFTAEKSELLSPLHQSFIRISPGTKLVISPRVAGFMSATLVLGTVLIINDSSIGSLLELNNRDCLYWKSDNLTSDISFVNFHSTDSLIYLIHSGPLDFESKTCKEPFAISHKALNMPSLVREDFNRFRLNQDSNSLYFSDLVSLKTQQANSAFDRARICCHENNESDIQEMFVLLTEKTILSPMKHLDKDESFLLLYGKMSYFFRIEGESEYLEIGMVGINESTYDFNNVFFLNIKKEAIHFPELTRSVIAKETTTGPFRPDKTILL